MTDETCCLVGRETPHARQITETHAARLRARGAVDSVRVTLYESDPERELRESFASISADSVYAVPMVTAHTRETETDVPRALRSVDADVVYLDPVGTDPTLAETLADRARDALEPTGDTSVILAGFGSSSLPYQRRTAERLADRLEAETDYDEVEPSFLLQNPAMECARYTVSNDRVVAVPMFVAHGPATRERIPAQLDLDRGGIAYADPIGDHPRLTDIVHAALEKRRVLSEGTTTATDTSSTSAPVATDGDGRTR
jgi:sirohydrochlorin ferrochelatase